MVLTHLILNDMMKVSLPDLTIYFFTTTSRPLFCLHQCQSVQRGSTCMMRCKARPCLELMWFRMPSCVPHMGAQVKGQIARIARCLQDPEPRIAGLAHLFFEELSHKVTKVSHAPAGVSTAHAEYWSRLNEDVHDFATVQGDSPDHLSCLPSM